MNRLQYPNSKLSDAITIFTVHEGDARRRIAAALPKLKVVNPRRLPSPLDKSYETVMERIERGRSEHLFGMPDYTLPHMHNSTASKLIAEIVRIQDELDRLLIGEEGENIVDRFASNYETIIKAVNTEGDMEINVTIKEMDTDA